MHLVVKLVSLVVVVVVVVDVIMHLLMAIMRKDVGSSRDDGVHGGDYSYGGDTKWRLYLTFPTCS